MIKGITKERIIEETKKLIAENGLSDFSLHVLAERLGIRTASLYTHISGKDEVLAEASKDILHSFYERQMQGIENKSREQALHALAESERNYAEENPAFYELIMNLQLGDSQELKDAAACIVEPVMKILSGYKLRSGQKTDVQRTFRAVVYGFICQEKNGYFSHFSESTDQSFETAIDMIADGIEVMEHEN